MSLKMHLLHEKYNRPLPRYTSYPPANYFHPQFTEKEFLEELILSNNEQPEHISIYIHVPFCHQLCHYCGCNAMKMNNKGQVQLYSAALENEMKRVFPLLSKTRKVSQIHFGGGTPSTLTVEAIQSLIRLIFDTFELSDSPEIAMECHPGYMDLKFLECLKNAGFNRISLGIQDFDGAVLDAVNRKRPQLSVNEIIDYIHAEMKASVNLDFIYGLPGQTPDSFLKSIQQAVKMAPDRIVTFPYAHMPQLFKRQGVLEKYGLPLADSKIEMFRKASDYLLNNNYLRVGMDHFVLPGDELWQAKEEKQLHRNFQGYCSRKTTGQVYAFGMSGISQLAGCYAQNTKDIDQYISRVENNRLPVEKGYKLSLQERLAREIVSSLMCNEVLSWPDIALRSGMNINEVKTQVWCNDEELRSLQEDGVIEIKDDGVVVTEMGKPFVRNVAVCFDPLFSDENRSFSKNN